MSTDPRTLLPDPGEPIPLVIGGRPVAAGDPLETIDPWSGDVVGRTFEATPEQLDAATAAAVAAFPITRRWSSRDRSELLRRLAELVARDRDVLAATMCAEIGKPLRDARLEVDRSALTIRLAAEEAERIGGEVVPLDLLETSRSRWGVTRRMPLGPVAAISPFNVPLSLAVHKVAPALAAGNPVVLKPDSRAAATLLHFGRLFGEAGFPDGAVSVLPMAVQTAQRMVIDERFRALSFTGSAAVGWKLRSIAGTKRVILELGGAAPLIVDADADVDAAITRTLAGAFKYAGQLCISVQRVYVHEAVADRYVQGVAEGAGALVVGDPFADGTDLGPMISEQAAVRAEQLIADAVADGARVLVGGARDGACVAPAVVEGVAAGGALWCEEAFAPIVAVARVADFDTALDLANGGPYGLQAGVFTRDVDHALRAYERLDVGAVLINDVPTFKTDNMPFGGTKSSGLGREGVRYAIDDLSELRLLVLGAAGA